MAVCILFAGHAAPKHTGQNIFKDTIYGECMLIILGTRNNITPKYCTILLLLDVITNDDTDIDRTRHNCQHCYRQYPALACFNNSGEYAFFRPFTLMHRCSV